MPTTSEHWADGGPTDLDNLILLCGYHHRFFHEHGWRIENDPDHKPVFHKPDGQIYPPTDPGSTPDSENWSGSEPRGHRPHREFSDERPLDVSRSALSTNGTGR